MDQAALKELLEAHEWRDVEFKEAQTHVPKNAYETVSAFANTEGGHLVFGVKKEGQETEIVGVLNVDKVQGDFLTTLNQRDKVSVAVDVREEQLRHDDADLLIFYVPEVHRTDKPVYLNGDIRRAFVRRGGSDFRCSESERNRFLMDAATERYEGQALDFDVETAFDEDSIRWYRAVYEARPGNRSYAALTDTEFLNEMGLLAGHGGHRQPTRAAILLFGANRTLLQILPRPIVDCQRYRLPRDEADPDERWFDRLVLEENLVRTWRALIEDWYPKVAEYPFQLDPANMQRVDVPPGYRAFRESMINLLIHQDYADHTRKAEICHYPDQTQFWNPGDAYAADADLLEPGAKEVRNPILVRAFRRIGLSENAGWGLRDVFQSWRELGHVPPMVDNDKGRKSFEVVLKEEALLSEEQTAFHRHLGLHLSVEQAEAFAFLCRAKTATISQIRAVIGGKAGTAQRTLKTLETQQLVRPLGKGAAYALAPHLAPLVDEAGHPLALSGNSSYPDKHASSKGLAKLTQQQRSVALACEVPRTLAELAELTGLPRRNLRQTHIQALLDANILRPTQPDSPSARNQRYVLTDIEVKLKLADMGDEESKSGD